MTTKRDQNKKRERKKNTKGNVARKLSHGTPPDDNYPHGSVINSGSPAVGQGSHSRFLEDNISSPTYVNRRLPYLSHVHTRSTWRTVRVERSQTHNRYDRRTAHTHTTKKKTVSSGRICDNMLQNLPNTQPAQEYVHTFKKHGAIRFQRNGTSRREHIAKQENANPWNLTGLLTESM